MQEKNEKINIKFENYKNNTNSEWNSFNTSSLVDFAKDIKHKNFTFTPFLVLWI